MERVRDGAELLCFNEADGATSENHHKLRLDRDLRLLVIQPFRDQKSLNYRDRRHEVNEPEEIIERRFSVNFFGINLNLDAATLLPCRKLFQGNSVFPDSQQLSISACHECMDGFKISIHCRRFELRF